LHRIIKKIAVVLLLGLIAIQFLTSSWFLKHFYPFPHRELVLNYSTAYHVDPYLVLSVIKAESRFYSNAHSRTGARGLMQIMPDTGTWIARELQLKGFNEEKLYEPAFNIPIGIWYLSYLNNVFGGNTIKALAAYNAGESKVKRWLVSGAWTGEMQDIEKIPYKETREYIDRVLYNYQVYKRIYKINGKGIAEANGTTL
jgi:soluble lytic murein transglycosylase